MARNHKRGLHDKYKPAINVQHLMGCFIQGTCFGHVGKAFTEFVSPKSY